MTAEEADGAAEITIVDVRTIILLDCKKASEDGWLEGFEARHGRLRVRIAELGLDEPAYEIDHETSALNEHSLSHRPTLILSGVEDEVDQLSNPHRSSQLVGPNEALVVLIGQRV